MKNASLLVLAVLVLGLTGCGDSQMAEANKVAEAARQSFVTAPEPLKTQFQDLKSAVDASDFTKAKTSLDQLKQPSTQLTPEQQIAVAEQEQTLLLKAATASQNGDANAAKLLQSVRSERRSR